MDHVMTTIMALLVSKYSVVNSEFAKGDVNVITDLGLNSIELISLFIDLEDCFGIQFREDDYDYDKIDTLRKICLLIKERMK